MFPEYFMQAFHSIRRKKLFARFQINPRRNVFDDNQFIFHFKSVSDISLHKFLVPQDIGHVVIIFL